MTLPARVRAPATTANLGPGFDCAAVALDLWNELLVTEAEQDGATEVAIVGEGEEELPRDETHLGLKAFALLSPTGGKRFEFTNRIPVARGLGSSAATIAVGLVAGAQTTGRLLEPEQLLELALELESHPDNLAAVFAGGACLTWKSGGAQRIARLAGDLPLVPVAVVPGVRVETDAARAALPARVSHEDATFNVGRAALLGAGIASGSTELLADAFHDRLHQRYRAAKAPLLEAVEQELPPGAVGVTLSGSGPTVIVWAWNEAAPVVTSELERRFPDEEVIRLSIAATGAGP